SIQIQNSGTVAGNLCNASPAADGVPPLLTLEAQVHVASRAGERALALSEFLTGVRQTALQPGEILTGLWLPPPPDHMRSAFLKLGARRYLVISIAMVSVLLLVEAGKILEARIAVGACSPVALRLPEMEAALSGTRPADCEERLTEAHLAPLSPISDVRADQAYRADAVLTLCIRAIAKAA
ncbi:MAG: FAD binding domain-containing protein, partial [Pseudomonadota bacterium]